MLVTTCQQHHKGDKTLPSHLLALSLAHLVLPPQSVLSYLWGVQSPLRKHPTEACSQPSEDLELSLSTAPQDTLAVFQVLKLVTGKTNS